MREYAINKIAIVGIGGAGKSFASRKIAEKTGLPLFHMDPLFWKGNWESVPEEHHLIEHKKLVEKDRWIIEGYIDEKMAARVKFADLIVYLDYLGIVCFWRTVLRFFRHRKKSRPELPKEALERFDIHFLWIVLTRGERKDIEAVLKQVDPSRIIRLKSPKQLNLFIKNQWG